MSNASGVTGVNELIDVSVFCGAWPFRAIPPRDPAATKARLQSHGVTHAWLSALEAVLYPDPMQGNVPMLEKAAGDAFFTGVPIINPTLYTWRRDLEECVKRFAVRAVKLTPNYHQLELADRRADELCELAAEKKLNVCVQLRMMDERTHHPLMKVPATPAAELAALAKRHPRTQFIACAIYNSELAKIRDASNVTVEISMVESGQALINALPHAGPERLVFGSHSPLLYFESALAKLNVDPQFVSSAQIAAIASGNARRLRG